MGLGVDVDEEKWMAAKEENNVLLSRSEPVHFIRLATRRGSPTLPRS